MLFIDIETLPTERPEIIDAVKSNLSAPSNYKDPEKIKAYIESNADKEVRKTALSGLFGSILCIGYAIDDEPVEIISGDEKEILNQFREVAVNTTGRVETINHTFVGHNIRNFDIPFLCQRMLINGIKPIYPIDTRKYDMRIIDTAESFAFGARDYFSLDNLCLAFGIESPKGDLDGSKVYDYYKDERLYEIYDYCEADVEAVRNLYQKMSTIPAVEESEAA